jgi:DNA polymerase I-like protein with 3'-5' exonuclease and polymerase domains
MFAAAFAVQASNMRAAANHRIQSSGAQITKAVQRKIWDIQPIGVSQWVVQPLNIHDEIHVAQRPETVDQVAEIVRDEVESYREQIPLIKMEWTKEEKSWADK